MSKCVRAIIVKDNSLLLMQRNKSGKQYYTLIGGHVEVNETLEAALLREIYEETTVKVSDCRLVYIEHPDSEYEDQYIYACEYLSGVPALHPDSEELDSNNQGVNTYTPLWVSLEELPNIPLRSEELKKLLLSGLKTEFPEHVLEFTSYTI